MLHPDVAFQDQFITPRAVMSLRLFNGFRVVVEKADDPAALLNFTVPWTFPALSLILVSRCSDSL